MLGKHTGSKYVTTRASSEPPTPGDGDEGLCGLEKYHLTHPLGEGHTLYSATSRGLSLFNAFNTFQMVQLL